MLVHYCGPRAIAALTGLTRDHAATLILSDRKARPRYRGKLQRGGTTATEVVAALRAAGCTVTKHEFRGNLAKLTRWLDEEGGGWLYMRPGHWAVILNGEVLSAQRESPRSRILGVWQVEAPTR